MNIETEIKEIKKMLRELVRDKRKEEDKYVPQHEAPKYCGYSVESLRKFRRSGKLKKIKKGVTGRGIMYNVEELEGLNKLVENN